MSWFIGRTEAMSNPEAARRKVFERLRGLAELDDPESMVVPILVTRYEEKEPRRVLVDAPEDLYT